MATDPKDVTAEVTDSTKYIRTFAKDMAAVTGQPAPPSPKPAPLPPPPPAPPKEVVTDGVGLPHIDESLITQAGLKKEVDSIDLSDAAASGSASGIENATEEPAVEHERRSILDRLKKRAPQHPSETPAFRPVFATPPVAPMPPVARQAPAPAPMPVQAPRPAPLPPTPTFTAPPQPAPLPQASYHTYNTDFNDHVRSQSADAFSVLAAQSDALRTSTPRTLSAQKASALPAVLAALVLIVLGGGAAYGAYWYTHRPNQVPVAPGVSSLIRYDEKQELTGSTGADLMQSLASAASGTLVEGNVLLTYITSASTTPKGVLNIPASGGALLVALPLNEPDILLRNTEDDSTIGVVHAGTEARPFFILHVSSYERTFAGMLAWEPTMKEDLALLYPSYGAPPPSAAGLFATSTTTTTYATTTVTKIVKGKKTQEVVTVPTPVVVPLPPPTDPTDFVDAVVDNHDVRILKDAYGRDLMLYGYADQQTLIIARDEAAFTLLVDRLNQAGGTQ